MTATAHQVGGGTVDVHGALRSQHGRGGLEGHAKHNFLAVADAALRAATAVGRGADAPIARLKKVVVLAAPLQRTGEAAADLEAFGRGQREHRLGEVGLEAVEDGLAQPRRHAAHATLDDAADGVALAAHGLDALDHFLGRRPVRAAHCGRLDFGQRGESSQRLRRRHDVVHLRKECANLHARRRGAIGLREDLLRNRPGRHAPDRLARGAAATPAMIPDAKFSLIGVVGVRRPELVAHLVVGAGPLVGVAHQHRDGRAGRPALEDAGEDFHPVLLVARGDDVALAGPPAVELGLDFRRFDGQARGAAIHHRPHCRAMALAPGGHGKKFPKRVRHRGAGALAALIRPASGKSGRKSRRSLQRRRTATFPPFRSLFRPH